MALIVENGTNVANADALITLDFHASYHLALGTRVTGATFDKEAAIRRGSAHVAKSYQWKGKPVNGRGQVFPFPMEGLVDAYGNEVASDSVPIEVQQAVAEAAQIELVSPGAFNPTANPRDSQIKSISEKLDVLGEATEWFRAGDPNTIVADTNKRIMDLLSAFVVQSSAFGLTTVLSARA